MLILVFSISPMMTAFSFDSGVIKSCCESVLTDDPREMSNNSSSEEFEEANINSPTESK